MKDLNGKVCVVTGGAGLLGEQHAMALAECGAKVILADIHEQRAVEKSHELNQKLGKESLYGVRLNVCEPASVEECHRKVLERFQSVHVLINNAAIDPKVSNTGGVEGSRLENFDLDTWNLHLSVGLSGAFLCAKTMGSWMAKNGGGVILNIASDLSVIAPDQRIYRMPNRAEDQQPVKPVTYSVVKTALIGLTRYLASYWAKDGVRVNAISPGGVYVEQSPEFVEKLTQLIPMGRMAQPTEYKAAIQFLCSDASAYMTGQNIVIDGGRSII